MSLCKTLLPLSKVCTALFGGIQRIWLFDPSDFDFTQAAFSATTGYAVYTAVALRTGAAAAGAKMIPIGFEDLEAEYTATQSRVGNFSQWVHTVTTRNPGIGQTVTNFNYFLDQASICCGVGMLVQFKTGKIIVLGEKYVNAAEIDVPLIMKQNGSSQGSGKVITDPNAQTTVITGDYIRTAFEYTGGLASILALE